MDELRRGDWAPRSVHRRHREISAAVRNIEQRTGREAREDEIVKELGISAETYHAALQDALQCQVLSLDAPSQDGEPSFDAVDTAGEPLSAIEQDEFHRAVADAISELPEREKLVLSLYYDEELNLREIGAVLDVSESRVCQIHGQALLRMRARLASWGAKQKARATC
jgi:RNA polymerase sigma factor for flagellar operon FliA